MNSASTIKTAISSVRIIRIDDTGSVRPSLSLSRRGCDPNHKRRTPLILLFVEDQDVAHWVAVLFQAAAAWRERLQSEVEAGAAINALVDRVDLTDTGIRVSLKVPIPEPVTRPAANAQELILTRFFPMTIRRRGVEMRLVIEGNRAHAPRADSALLKAVARAHQWSEDLLMGRAQSVKEIAEREGVADRYLRRLMRLAFLAPAIVEAI